MTKRPSKLEGLSLASLCNLVLYLRVRQTAHTRGNLGPLDLKGLPRINTPAYFAGSPVMKKQNKLEGLYLASLSSLVLYL